MSRSILNHSDRKKLRIAAVVVFVISFLLPTFNGSELRGYEYLGYGLLSGLTGHWLATLSWLANPLFLISLAVPAGLRKVRLLLGTILLGFAFLVFFVREIPVDDRGGIASVTPRMGAMIWFLGALLLFLYHFLRRKASHKHGS